MPLCNPLLANRPAGVLAIKCMAGRNEERMRVSVSKGISALQNVSRRSASSYAQINVDAVRQGDYAGFLVATFWPPALRDSYIALHALNLELASIPESVSNAQIGAMRYQFWREAVASVFEGKPARHPVTMGLAKATSQARLSKYHFDRLINAREANLKSPAFADLQALSSYAQDTAYRISALELQLSQAGSPLSDPALLTTIDHSLTHVALTQTIATLLASAPYHASKRRSIFPLDVAAEAGLVEESLYKQGRTAPGVADATAHLVAVAEGQMAVAREHLPAKLDPTVYPVFLSVTASVNYLDRLKKAQYDVYSPSLGRRSAWLPLRLWYKSLQRHV